ncbi:MAG: PaaI family thioesterase [Halomonadaceae bacterium]|nr:MAG: PaaI family thioesterase [Halomonadaceae bacterium]
MGRVSRFIGTLKHCQHLGIRPVSAITNELVLELPYSQRIVGNPETGVIHGGAITTLMDTASGTVVICALPEFELCPTLDLRVDYMRAANPGLPVFARATAYRVSGNIIFTRCETYQESPRQTVAHCVATFMRIGSESTPKAYRQLITGEAAP